MENVDFNSVLALGLIDDGLVSEAAEIKRPKRSFVKYAAAAAAALALTAGLVFAAAHFSRKPQNHSALSTDGPLFSPMPEPTEERPESTFSPAEPTDAPLVTGEPSPEATSKATPQATGAPQPTYDTTSEPYVPKLVFSSLDEFVSAVREGADPLLAGIDRYYTADNLPEERTFLSEIRVTADTVEYTFFLAGGAEFDINWVRDADYSRNLYDGLMRNYPEGNMHGDNYVFLTQAGNYATARLDGGLLLRTFVNVHCSEEEIANWSVLMRHAI